MTKPLNPLNGIEKPREIAIIDEEICIGCTKCIQACPVDAIVGASKVMHTIVARECTGCELCIAPCPVDCIDMIAAPDDGRTVLERAPYYRARFDAHLERLARDASDAAAELASRKAALDSGGVVNDAVARARARRAARGGSA